jgi:hypothetical protein
VPNNTPAVVARDLTLDNFEGITFQISSTDLDSINAGIAPRSLQRALNGLAEKIDRSIYAAAANYAYQVVGTAGTTPFASSLDILNDAYRQLTTANTPTTERYFALDEFAFNNATKLTQFREADKFGGSSAFIENAVSRAVGYGWYTSNNVPLHTTTATGNYAIDAAALTGANAIVVDNAAGALPAALVVGDVISIAGSTQTYAVTSYTAGTTDSTVGIFPALDQDVADGDVVTVTASHKLNLAFQSEAIAFASRPFNNTPLTPSVVQRTIPDPMTGLVLDLRVQDGYYLGYWTIAALWGTTVVAGKEGGIVRVLG